MTKICKEAVDITDEEFYMQRSDSVMKEIADGKDLYPHKFDSKDTIYSIIEEIETNKEQFKSARKVQSAGRVTKIRIHARYSFIEIMSNDKYVQLVYDVKEVEGDINKFLKRGDIVGFTGYPGRTRTKEGSVFVTSIQLLAPCLRTIPTDYYGLKDPELIYRRRYMDLLLNPESKHRFVLRAQIVQYIRNFFINLGFLEVETPMMNMIPGGAAAKPFVTYHNDLKTDLYMRIAPEIYLKKLVIGGMDRVFEIGKQFRNEGIDLTHNPEFTSCEFYTAYADYENMMENIEELLGGMVYSLHGKHEIVYHPNKRGELVEPVKFNFKAPFMRLDILEELSRALDLKLTDKCIEEKETLAKLLNKCAEHCLNVDKPHTLTRVLDKLIGHFIEPQCVNPTFITGYPIAMSPLAKNHRSMPRITERFELFVNCKEICNGYTELNNPFEQRKRFMQQAKDLKDGDDEAMMMDEDFCTALEYGLPPTGGCGIGIDRLVMYLTNAANIRDVILFPAMRPESNK